MKNGLIEFLLPKDCDPSLRRAIRKMTAKKFEIDRNFSLIDDDSSVVDLIMEE